MEFRGGVFHPNAACGFGFFFSSRRRHTRSLRDWSSDVCSSDLLSGSSEPVLIDCGASSLIALKRAGLDPSEIGYVLLTHLHGDHFGGLPFLVLDGQFSRRTRPLVVGGPPGVRERVEAAMEVFFPGSSKVDRRFAVEFVELREHVATPVAPAAVTPFVVKHASGAPAYALRVEYG